MRDDIERVLVDEEVIEKRLDSMALDIERDFPGGKLVVIILLKGALVFAADLLRRVPRVLEIECLNVASYHGGLESSGQVDFLDRHFPEVKGRHVLLLDDILDTGRTLKAVSDRLTEEGAVAVHTAVLLAKDKERDGGRAGGLCRLSRSAMNSSSATASTIRGNTGTCPTSACSRPRPRSDHPIKSPIDPKSGENRRL